MSGETAAHDGTSLATRQLAADEERLRGRRRAERPSSGNRPRGGCSSAIACKLLLDKDSPWLEVGLWAGWEMYSEWGERRRPAWCAASA